MSATTQCERCREYNAASVDFRNQASKAHAAHDALLARHNALRDAVAWERECCQDIRPLVAWADLYARHGEDYVDAIAEALREIQDAARSEVDRLIANESSTDCQGEG